MAWLQHALHLAHQALTTRATELAGRQPWVNPGPKQGLTRVNIARTDHDVARQQRLLDRHLAPFEVARAHSKPFKVSSNGSRPSPANNLPWHARRLRLAPHHGTKSPWIVQAQHPARGHQIKVVMRTRFTHPSRERQGSRHPQMHQQAAAAPVTRIQRQPQILAPTLHRAHLPTNQLIPIHPQRPAQRLARVHGEHLRTLDAISKTQTGNFNFGQFWHPSII
jgi:hypothetical protein